MRMNEFCGTENRKRVLEIIGFLEREYSDAKVALHYADSLELLIATILSAQTTDERVNIVTKSLFKKYRTPEDYANADVHELEEIIRSTGFYHNKAKNIKKTGEMLVERVGSERPHTLA